MMRVAIFGGSGFVGSFLVDALIAAGHEPSLMVRLGSERKVRQAERCRLVAGNLSSTTAIDATLENCDAVIYSVGILKESPKQGITFEELQYNGVVRVAESAKARDISRFLLMSANGAKSTGTPYQETKFRAEIAKLEKSGNENAQDWFQLDARARQADDLVFAGKALETAAGHSLSPIQTGIEKTRIMVAGDDQSAVMAELQKLAGAD